MKLFSQALELKALRTMAVSNGLRDGESATNLSADAAALRSSLILASVDESFFQYAPTKAAYKRLTQVAQKRSRILSYDQLVEDPSLDEEFRDILKEDKRKAAKSDTDTVELIAELDRYRKLRLMYEASKSCIESLKDSKADPDAMLEYLTGMVSAARSRDNLQDKILSLGEKSNALDLIDSVLTPETDVLIKTGYTEFDERNGGLPAEGVFILAGTTSGGKSVIRMNLCDYMYRVNHRSVLTVSLEMNATKEARRLISSRTRIPLWKFTKGQLTDDDRKKIRKSWKKYNKIGVENDCRYSLFCPTRGLTIDQLLLLIKPFDYSVVAIDYVSLLDGVDEKEQWKALSSIVRKCKIFSGENKCLVILLAQLDSEDDRIRYSRGMLEHADACWTWNYSKPEQRELRELPIQQRKARDQELFPFVLKEEFDIMRASNPDGADDSSGTEADAEQAKPKKHGKAGKSKPTRGGEDAITFDVD